MQIFAKNLRLHLSVEDWSFNIIFILSFFDYFSGEFHSILRGVGEEEDDEDLEIGDIVLV